MKVLGDRLLLKIIPPTNLTKGGLLLSTVQEEDLPRGKVIEIGEDVKNVYSSDVVIIGKYSGTDVIFDFITYKLIREADILIVL